MDPFFLMNIDWDGTKIIGQVSESVIEPFWCLDRYTDSLDRSRYALCTFTLTLEIGEYLGSCFYICLASRIEYPIQELLPSQGHISYDSLFFADRTQLLTALEGPIKEPPIKNIRHRLQSILALD